MPPRKRRAEGRKEGQRRWWLGEAPPPRRKGYDPATPATARPVWTSGRWWDCPRCGGYRRAEAAAIICVHCGKYSEIEGATKEDMNIQAAIDESLRPRSAECKFQDARKSRRV